MAGSSTGSKGWTKDNRPARARYWTRRTLEKRKIKRMMKAYGLSESKAKERWYAERNSRRVKGDYMDYSGGKANTHIKAAFKKSLAG